MQITCKNFAIPLSTEYFSNVCHLSLCDVKHDLLMIDSKLNRLWRLAQGQPAIPGPAGGGEREEGAPVAERAALSGVALHHSQRQGLHTAHDVRVFII